MRGIYLYLSLSSYVGVDVLQLGGEGAVPHTRASSKGSLSKLKHEDMTQTPESP